jgi:hypothetical protein
MCWTEASRVLIRVYRLETVGLDSKDLGKMLNMYLASANTLTKRKIYRLLVRRGKMEEDFYLWLQDKLNYYESTQMPLKLD